ncbi:MAG: bifunctional oligoribonuclease/PAP phosphatase NrnA [Anaerolineae bacterium]|nr:bifunctional oligoribonuclease/PAP phosphatase NrnA [Anaerolineae bacterium]
MNNALIKDAHDLIHQAQRVLVTSHIRPDGDAVGSLLGLGLALQESGKEVQMILADGVPKAFRHLSGSEQVYRKPQGTFDAVIVVDCSDLGRVGSVLDNSPGPDLSIDHHITNLNFARINLVDIEATSTTEILTSLIPALNLSISTSAAEALLTGIITDTLGFRTTNMRPQAMRVAADLMSLGIDLPTLYNKALLSRSFHALRYWGSGLNNLQLENRLVWTALTIDDRIAVNYPGRDDADLINVLSTIDDADIAIIFVEQKNGSVKVSWRARPGFDVSKVALQFGGGGHKPASGAEIEGDLDEVQQKVLYATRAILS